MNRIKKFISLFLFFVTMPTALFCTQRLSRLQTAKRTLAELTKGPRFSRTQAEQNAVRQAAKAMSQASTLARRVNAYKKK